VTTEIALYPTPEQIQTLLAEPPDRPVVMVNLLRFKEGAEGGGAGIDAAATSGDR
jgi:hypothetical protein